MARIRTIKPELAAHEGLYDLERDTGLPIRFAWAMLFTVADREGRFAWRARTLKAQILPHDDLDFSRVLDAWLTRGFVRKYRVGDEWFGWIPTFTKHQVINNRESQSDLPPIEQADEEDQSVAHASATRRARVGHASATREVHAQAEGKEGREGKERKEDDASGDKPPSAAGAVNGNAVAYIPLNDGSQFSVSAELAAELSKLYPAVDVPQTLNEIRGWNISHPAKRKTRKGVMAHINSWMSKEQNRG